jgi:hypothetical protein
MRCRVWIGTLLATLIICEHGLSGEPPCCPPPEDCFLARLAPVGGWHPYGGGLLSWWPAHCFPCYSGPDDYSRKSLPRVCWPLSPPCSGRCGDSGQDHAVPPEKLSGVLVPR